MNLFTQDSSLKSMNEVLVKKIPDYDLIGDLPLTKEDFYHLASIIKMCFESGIKQTVLGRHKESLAVFLVFSAVYQYDNRTFWKPIEEYMGELSYNERMALYAVFAKVVSKYDKNLFENESEEGYTYVTPILCHAGIPINAFDNYFAAISNTVNDAFYDDFDVEDYLAYLKNKTEITVKRFITLSNKRDSYNFIQNTRKLILFDSVDKDEEVESGNYIRMLEQVSLWKDKPKNKKTLQARKNVQITAPKIKIDLDGVGIYCELPRTIVKDCYDSYVIWEISSDESTKVVKADFFRRSGVFVAEEKIIPLKPAQTYSITLKVDDNLISKWEYDGVRESYIAFSTNGNIVKTEYLPNSTIILLLHENERLVGKDELSILELPKIPFWTSYQVYKMDLLNLTELSCTGTTIRVHSEDKPLLDGGETLFNQENSRAYIKLPSIKVPELKEGEWHIEIKRKSGSNVIHKINAVAAVNYERIDLSSYIENECYGEYDIRIWNRTGINGRFAIEYVPFGTIQIDKNDYWPSKYQGYMNHIQYLRTSKEVEIEIFNAEDVSEIRQEDTIIHRYKLNEKDRYLIGDYRYTYNGYEYSTSIKKSIYPISWGVIGLEHEIIELSSKVYTLTPQDLKDATDPYLLFAFDFEASYDIQKMRIDLIGADRKIVHANEVSILNKDGLRIPLNPYLFEILNSTTDIDYHLRITLFDSVENMVTTFLVARFQDEVVVKNARHKQDEDHIFITWEEMGTRCGREIVFVNFLKPWLEPVHFKVEDKVCEVAILNELLDEGIYRYVIQKEADDLFMDEGEAEICTLRDFQRGKIVIKGERKYSSEMERILYQLLRSRFLKSEVIPRKLSQIKSEIGNLQAKGSEDIHLLAHAYILHDRFFAEKEDAAKIRKLFSSLFDLFLRDGNETMKYVLESNFTTTYKKDLLHKFYCTNLTSTTRINEYQNKLLSEIDEDMAGFINLIQFENNARGLDWSGISDLGVLREEDLFGEGDADSTFLSDENLGKSSYITQYFQYVSNSLLRPKNMTKNSLDFIREFQKEHEVEETMIFGKTRLHLLVEWKDQSKTANQIQENLAHVTDFPCKAELKNQFQDVFIALSKRRQEDELGYYIGLTALYASLIRNGFMRNSKEFSHLLQEAIGRCGKLYYRDAIIIELYMRQERGYSWV